MAADNEDEGFLTRWSRLKGAGSTPPEKAAGADPADREIVAEAPAVSEDRKEKVDIADLPSIESLSGESDFSGFLREGVPEGLRRQALRKLWVSDPVIAAPDVFDVYNLDYFNMPSFPEGVKTLFRVGSGMLDEAQQQAEKQRPATPDSQDKVSASGASSEVDSRDIASQHPRGVLPLDQPGKPHKT